MKNYFKNRKPEHIDLQLESMKKLMEFFKKECGVYSYILYGTLLGAVRNGNVIPNDTDYDIGYMSKGKNIKEVREEWKRICTILINHNMLGKIWIKGGSIIQPKLEDLHDFSGQMHVKTPDGRLHIDVYSSFCLNREFHLSLGIQGQLDKYDIVPFKHINLRGIDFVAPRNPEVLLEYMYGEDWMIPKDFKSKVKRKLVWQYE